MLQRESIHERAKGRWRYILPALGIASEFLNGRHGPCPICGGRDRFRFDDRNGEGGYICGQCGPGRGPDLIMKKFGVEFIEAVRMIEQHIGAAPVLMPQARNTASTFGDDVWTSAVPLDGMCAASKYLRSRGIRVAQWPGMLRFAKSVPYNHEDGSKTRHPVLVARFCCPGREAFSTHFTYLKETGAKADLGDEDVRKFAPGKVPQGGAVRLAGSAETMGIATGVETALSAMQIDNVPVWATLTDGLLVKWQPPPHARHILIYGDNDSGFGGQAAAFALAHRLASNHNDQRRVEVRIPGLHIEKDDAGSDWNDVLKMQREEFAA